MLSQREMSEGISVGAQGDRSRAFQGLSRLIVVQPRYAGAHASHPSLRSDRRIINSRPACVKHNETMSQKGTERAGEMAQSVEHMACKDENPSSSPGICGKDKNCQAGGCVFRIPELGEEETGRSLGLPD